MAALVNAANGMIAGQWEYDPFLGISRASGALASFNPFLGSTKFYDSETGLYYYGYRYYDLSAGRWLNRELLGELESSNPFRTASNNSVNHYDVLGLYEEAGHFWTVYVVAQAGGMTPNQAFQYAYYAQLPDEFAAFDAKNAGLATFPFVFPNALQNINDYLGNYNFPNYEREIQELLHSLHGGDQQAVNARRDCLQKLLQTVI